jgi:hypothetical protein
MIEFKEIALKWANWSLNKIGDRILREEEGLSGMEDGMEDAGLEMNEELEMELKEMKIKSSDIIQMKFEKHD